MAIPYSSESNMPLGLETVTINSVTYIVVSIDIPSFDNRLISRTNENGDRAGYMIRKNSEPIEGPIVLQRADTSTPLPPEGDEFSCDYDRSGQTSTLTIKNVKVARSTDEFDQFEIDVVLKTYQG